jgi:hypothetical protein
VARTLVATTWRDPEVLGPFRMDQLICVGIAVGAFLLMTVLGGAALIRGRREPATPPVDPVGDEAARAPGEPDWPDPSTRPWI